MTSKWFRDTVADRRKRVAELHGKGLLPIVIARRLGIADWTVSQDLLALGLRKPRAAACPEEDRRPVQSQSGVQACGRAAEPLTPHELAKLDLIGLQALFLDGLNRSERAAMTGKTIQFTLAELSRDDLIAAILRQHETPVPEYPRAPAAGRVAAVAPLGGTQAGHGGGGGTGDAAVPAPRTAAVGS